MRLGDLSSWESGFCIMGEDDFQNGCWISPGKRMIYNFWRI